MEARSAARFGVEQALRVMRDETTDAELMSGVARGDSAMLGLLYRRHGRGVRGAIRRWFPDLTAADADDLVQDVFLALGDSAKRYRERERFKAWLFTIAHRKAQDLRRQRLRRIGDPAMRGMETVESTGAADAVAHDVRSEMRQAIRQMVERLPGELREVLFLKAVEGFSAGEIGRITGVEEATVRTRLHRARQQILESADASKWRQLLEGGVP